MSGGIEKCEHCGTTKLIFDPPLVFEPTEACGAVKPGTYGAIPGGIPECQLPAGHDPAEQHLYLVEYLERWG